MAGAGTARRDDEGRGTMTDQTQTVLISGASGMIGTELTQQLRAQGHTVLSLVRRAPRAHHEHAWSPTQGIVDHHLLGRVDAVVNVSGAPLGRLPWTPRYRREIRDSRVQATTTLVRAMARTDAPPRTFLSGSAVGFYGDRPLDRLTEGSGKGHGFLADVVEAWEAAASGAPEGTRTALLRTGIVLGPGGAVKPLVPLTRLGLGATMGSGKQYWPWISLHDEAAAIVHLLTSELAGPVNLVGPEAATSTQVTEGLAQELHRPHALRVPEGVIATGMGDAGREMLLASQRVVPEALLADGFTFRHRTLPEALDALVPLL